VRWRLTAGLALEGLVLTNDTIGGVITSKFELMSFRSNDASPYPTLEGSTSTWVCALAHLACPSVTNKKKVL
jgi:hypothetical protein